MDVCALTLVGSSTHAHVCSLECISRRHVSSGQDSSRILGLIIITFELKKVTIMDSSSGKPFKPQRRPIFNVFSSLWS